jgi:hypothetical protein
VITHRAAVPAQALAGLRAPTAAATARATDRSSGPSSATAMDAFRARALHSRRHAIGALALLLGGLLGLAVAVPSTPSGLLVGLLVALGALAAIRGVRTD